LNVLNLQEVDTVVVGGGQAGLSLSYYLTQQDREHVVLEQAEHLGHTWRMHRWNSFTLVTPNWSLRLPGFGYQGNDPHGFLLRDEVVSHLEDYAAHFDAPTRLGVLVDSVEPTSEGDGYVVRTSEDDYKARNVVMATGLFQTPKTPTFSAHLPANVRQMPSADYRFPEALPPGAVLVVGSAQSGCQIAEELYQSGRRVYLCVGRAGRIPRRYRGQDIMHWLQKVGFFDRTAENLPSPQARFRGNPHLSGKGGGRTLNLHRFARDGVTLLGHMTDADDGKIALAPDLNDSLAQVDQFEVDLLKRIDEIIMQGGLDAPLEDVPTLRDGYQDEVVTELDLQAANINTVIWAVGYEFDFGLVKLPVVDDDGYPVSQRGVTAHPGLYFLGLPWLHTVKSGLFLGVGEDAAHVAQHIAGRDN
jgi:putative flavoprotein involved in K+ transport